CCERRWRGRADRAKDAYPGLSPVCRCALMSRPDFVSFYCVMSPASAPASGSLRQAYLVVFVGISGALHVWKLPPVLPMLTDEFGLTLVESGFLLSLVQLGGLALGLVMGLLAGKIGLRRSVLIGLFLLGAASAAGALPHDKNLLMALRGVEGCGFLMVVMPCPALIR